MAAAQGHQAIMATLPDASLFSFPPRGQPAPLAPSPAPLSVMRPFNIPQDVFVAALDFRVPMTVAALYAVTVKALNSYNGSRDKQPWAISKTRPFAAFVVVHNVLLALYSAWSFCGMLGAMRRSVVSPMGPGGLAASADSFCHLHGPPGLGASVYFNETSAGWETAAAAGPPSSLQMGRIWNEGLAYYGWIFYLSKFYEVLDTFVILAKGRFSSTLQTYHHAGAMMCMWAGMRYMSAPIWMFVLINSFIHSLMYTYYTLTAFSVKVPLAVKRTLTSMQITQFLVGASYAMAHSFVTYVAPVTVTRIVSAPADVPPAPAEPVIPTAASVALGALRKLLFGSGPRDGAPTAAVAPVPESTIVTETAYVGQPCIVTTGETFAIWLNVLYLAPLTYLFVSFFIASYVKRSNAAHKADGEARGRESNVALAEKAGWDAARDVEREVYGGENMVDGSGNGNGNGTGTGGAVADGKRTPKKTNTRLKRTA